MKSSNVIVWIIGAVLVIGVFGWAVSRVINKDSSAETSETGTATTTNSTSTSQAPTGAVPAKTGTSGQTFPSSALLGSYNNATYSFKISYPRDLHTEPFGVFHTLNQNDWRINATTNKRGTPVVSIPIIRTENESGLKKLYPLYFAAEVRVGVSPDTAQCYAKDDGYTNQTVTDVNINGVTWKKFIFGDAAMTQYVSGASYRTIRNNRCYVIEQIRTGSNYRDETMATAYTDKDLNAFYARTTPIVMSFKFTK